MRQIQHAKIDDVLAHLEQKETMSDVAKTFREFLQWQGKYNELMFNIPFGDKASERWAEELKGVKSNLERLRNKLYNWP